jgi:homoserine O-acetyltransferase
MDLPAHLGRQLSAATRFIRLGGRFELENGASLPDVVVAYRTWGRIENAVDRAILVCHALTGSADVDAWWPGLIGEGCAFDPAHDFVICANILGSCYGTTGPASLVPGSGRRYRADFPEISVRDMVALQGRLLDVLGIERLELVVGPSLGGMQALEWAAMYPERVGSVIPIGVGAVHSPWCIGISEAQRAAIAADPDWCDGYYSDAAPPERGLAAARMMAVCTYRSWQNFEERFGRERNDAGEFEVQSYLRHQGRKINQRFDANAYVKLTRAMHTHDLGRGRGRLGDVLAKIDMPALVVSVSSDGLYPPAEQARLAAQLGNARYEILESAHGHDGFLIETRALGALVAAFRTRPQGVALVERVSGEHRRPFA